MKKVLSLLMVVVLTACCFVGCGKGENQNGKPDNANILTDGYWVANKILMEGTEIAGEEMVNIFGSPDNVMAIVFNEDNTLSGVSFEEFFKGTYSGTKENLTLDFLNEQSTAVCPTDTTMEITLKDGSKFFLAKQQEKPESISKNPWVTYPTSLDSTKTIQMSNFMNNGCYLLDGDVLYGLAHDDTGKAQLGSRSFYMKGDFPAFNETKVIDAGGYATYINMDGDNLYYVRDNKAICRVNKNGGDVQTIFEGDCDYLQIHEGRLYFTDKDYKYVSTDMNGGDLKTVINREVYYPYFVSADWVVFQDDKDDESLHLLNVALDKELNVTNDPAYCPIIAGKYLYYTEKNGKLWSLSRVDISNPDKFLYEQSDNTLLEAGFLVDDVSIYTANSQSEKIEDWANLKDDAATVETMRRFVSEGYTVYHEFDAEGLISGKYLSSKAESGATSFK